MPVTKRIVCLANSRKPKGRCVAGIELAAGRPAGWIRPVSAREGEEVSDAERGYEDGTEPCVLDIIAVPLLEPRPKGYQRENWLLDADRRWKKAGVATWSSLAGLADPVGPLWIDGHKTYHGAHDTIPLALAEPLTSSLRLLHVDHLGLLVFTTGEAFNNPRRRVQGHFQHAGASYRLWVTDLRYEITFQAKKDGEYAIGECYLTVSLAQPHEGSCYKVIAAVIEPSGAPPA